VARRSSILVWVMVVIVFFCLLAAAIALVWLGFFSNIHITI
jgi:hypothetical protein